LGKAFYLNCWSKIWGVSYSAIKGQYKNEKQLMKEKQEKEKLRQLEEDKKRKQESLVSKAGLEFGRIEKEKFLSSLTEEQKENLLKDILDEVSLDSFAVSHIKKKGLDSPSASLFILNRIKDFSARKTEYVTEKLKEAGF
jgi:hypothetical protein